ncbi:MAG: hypothetical protein K8S21_03170 [Gemmatimonadetes bacterium]|nr:hypothetical protein [Gemmatimonadota bacterium]
MSIRITGARRLLSAAAFPVAASLCAIGTLGAQGTERSIEGTVTRPGPTAAGLPVAGAWAVLHRVGADTAGPIDSMRTTATGVFRFRYRATGDSLAVYFVSTSRGGVSYFTPPARERVVRGGSADLLVFDTTSAPIPIRVRGRHLIVTAPDSATGRTRTLVEAYELSNDSSVTRIARGRRGITFDAALPEGVATITAGQGDVSSDAVVAEEGRMRLNAPLSPGLKQVTFSYELPARTDPIEILVEAPTTVLEVLVEDANAQVAGAGLVAVDPVQIEGRAFRRFLAQDVAAAQTFSVSVPPSGSSRQLRVMLIVTAVGAAMLLGLGMFVMRGGPGGFTSRRLDDPEALALAVAALDAAHEGLSAPTEQQKAEHYLARARLKGRLANALAKRDGLR